MSDVIANKKRFSCWLTLKGETPFRIDALIWNIDSIRVCYSKIKNEPLDIWLISEPEKLDTVLKLIKEEMPDSFPIRVSPEPIIVLKEYLSDMVKQEMKSGFARKKQSASCKKSDYRRCLEETIIYLLRKYFGKPPCLWDQLRYENSVIDFDCFCDWTKTLYGIEAEEFLFQYGLVERLNSFSFHQRVEKVKTRQGSERANKARENNARTNTARSNGLNMSSSQIRSFDNKKTMIVRLNPDKPFPNGFVEAMDVIKRKYRIEPAKSLRQIEQENPKITAEKLNRWTYEVYGMSAKNYLTLEKLMERKDKSWRGLNALSRQPAWNKRETVLLINSCNRILIDGKDKSVETKKLSVDLRRMAIRGQIDIDTNYRDEIEVSIQMTKMIYLLTDGEQGMPGANAIFCEMVDLMKNQPGYFTILLNETLSDC